MKKADFVYGLIMRFEQKTIMLFERRADGVWTLFGGETRPDKDEADTLYEYAKQLFGEQSDLYAIEKVGPLHDLPDGRTAQAYVCTADKFGNGESEQYAQWRWIEGADLLTSVYFDPALLRLVWDGFSMLEQPTTAVKQLDGGVMGIFCDPGREHVLVEETETSRVEWPRLDPKSGQPMIAS